MAYGLNLSVETTTADILVVVDAGTILNLPASRTFDPDTSRTSSPPTIIDIQYVYLVTENQNALTGNGHGTLDLSAITGDNIRWRTITTAGTLDYTAIVDGLEVISSDSTLSEADAMQAETIIKVPNPVDPLHPGSGIVSDYYYQSTVENVSALDTSNNPIPSEYMLYFSIYRRTDLRGRFGVPMKVTVTQ